MEVLITLQPALALPVFLNLMMAAYEAERFSMMVFYAVIWFVFGALFLIGRYWFDLLVNGKFFYKTVENMRDICLGKIYEKEQNMDSQYNANPYYAFLCDEVEIFTVILFRIDRLVAVLLVTAVFFCWTVQISVGMAVLASAGGILSVFAGNIASKKLNQENEKIFSLKTQLNNALRVLFYGTESYMAKGKYWQVSKRCEQKTAEYNAQNCENAKKASTRTNVLTMMDCAVYMAMILWCAFFLKEKSAAVILTMIAACQTMKGYMNRLNSVWMMLIEKKYVIDHYCDIRSREEPEKKQALSGGNVIEICNLCYQASENEILKDINIAIRQNEKVALIGLNGAGKSTLLRCILRLSHPTGGEIRWKEPFACSYIPVNPQLFPVSIIANIWYASCDDSGGKALDITDIIEAADIARIDSIGLDDELPDGDENLSGGEAQRVAIARAFAGANRIIIADEPTANLDIQTEKKVIRELFRRADTLLYTTHNPELVSLADRVYIMKKGRIAACGTPDEVRNLPVYQEWEKDRGEQ